MNSVILRTTTQLLITVLLLLSVFWLLRGHDLPGGGFIGGLVAAAALALYAIANGLARENWLSPQPTAQRRTDWVCQDCSDPDCELRIFTGLLTGNAKRFSVK